LRTIFFFICILTQAESYSQKFDWVNIIKTKWSNNGETDEKINDIKSNESSVFISFKGYSYGNYFKDYGDSIVTLNNEIHLAKFNTKGDFIWKRQLGNIFNSFTGIELDNDSAIIYGSFTTQMVLNSDTLYADQCALFIAKLDHNGNTIWLKKSSDFFFSSQVVPLAMTKNEKGEIFLAIKNEIRNPFYFDSINFIKPIDSYINTTYVFQFNKFGNQMNRIGFDAYWNKDFNFSKPKQLKWYNGKAYLLMGNERNWGLSVPNPCFYTKFYVQIKEIDFLNTRINDFIDLKSDGYFEVNSFDISKEGDFLLYGSRYNKIKVNNNYSIGNSSTLDQCDRYCFHALINKNGQLLWSNSEINSSGEVTYGLFDNENNIVLSTTKRNEQESSGYPDPFPSGRSKILMEKVNIKGKRTDSFPIYCYIDNEYTTYSPNFSISKDNFFVFANYSNAFDSISKSLISNFTSWSSFSLSKISQNAWLSNKPYDENDFSIYPNPASNYVIICQKEQSDYSYQLFDISGRRLNENIKSSNSNFHTIELSTYPNGIYLLNIISGHNIHHFKIKKNE
jgi:hypothetical protein